MKPGHISRRKFLKTSAAFCAVGAGVFPLARKALASRPPYFESAAEEFLVEARYYERLPHRKIRCTLCPRECVIDDQERGYCGVRENRGGIYWTLVHSRPCSLHLDPIEKKPLFHFLPGTEALSIATVGCNVNCKFCQNWQISQVRPEQEPGLDGPPEAIVRLAVQRKCPTIAYTYTEPVIFYEYMYDTAELGREQGIKSVMITNGYISKEPMKKLCRVLDAVKIDLKAYTEKFYREFVVGGLKPVLDTLVLLKDMGMWTEIVYLIIPTLNDQPGDLKAMCRWIASELGPGVPLHFSRFYPQYQLKNIPPTPVSTLERTRDIALEAGLHYVYIGNVPGHPGESTTCPSCGETIIHRIGYTILDVKLNGGKCSSCGEVIPGVWK
ncbi:AmmeMemoRadiSam system radical SAM enzyme [candidate division KSB1 bacterium]|nr:AmmeMemoRadiSam system radical SAM enzyme [candidate division KSB1 bacterium]